MSAEKKRADDHRRAASDHLLRLELIGQENRGAPLCKVCGVCVTFAMGNRPADMVGGYWRQRKTERVRCLDCRKRREKGR